MDNKNLFSIGEVAKSIGITRKIILNYEAKGLLTPDKKDGISGNRYYTIDTFTRIQTIRIFQKLGLSLDEIREYLNGSSDLTPMINRLENMRNELNMTIEKLYERRRNDDRQVKEIMLGARTVYCRSYNAGTIADKTNMLRDTALEAMREYGTDVTERMYFTEYSIHEPDMTSYYAAVPLGSEGINIKKAPPCKAISLIHHGSYETLPNTRKMLVDYAERNGIAITGVIRNIFLEGPPQHKDPSKFVTQVAALIE